MATAPRIACEISAAPLPVMVELARIIRTCAADLGQGISVRISTRGSPASHPDSPVLTLHLPAALAAAQHPVWCLACRLACSCPNARVSVLVHGETTFGENSTPVSDRRPQTLTRRLRAAG